MSKRDSIMEIFGEELRQLISGLPKNQLDKLEEIRLRAGCPIAVKKSGGRYFLAKGAGYTYLTKKEEDAQIVRGKDLIEALAQISGYSVYAFEEEIRNGFISVKGGHRIGLCGRAVVEGGQVKTLRNISSLSIRLCREVKGAADGVMAHIIRGGSVCHTLIVSPPGKGKTTLLRDIVRQLSNGVPVLGFYGTDVAVVDERSEIAGAFMGVNQNDVGIRTDILDCCPKAKGMYMLLRSMSPSVVAVDEIGGREDIAAIEEMLSAGTKLICTVHGSGPEDIRNKPGLSQLIAQKYFETIIVLSSAGRPGEIGCIYDKDFKSREVLEYA